MSRVKEEAKIGGVGNTINYQAMPGAVCDRYISSVFAIYSSLIIL